MTLAVKKPPANAGDIKRRRFDLWVRKIPWREGMATHSSIIAWRFRGQRSMSGYGPGSCKGSDTTEQLSTLKKTTFELRVGCDGGPWVEDHCARYLSSIQSQCRVMVAHATSVVSQRCGVAAGAEVAYERRPILRLSETSKQGGSLSFCHLQGG